MTVKTGHQPLVSISSSPHLWRQILWLSQYNVNIEFLKRKENDITDALLRVSLLPVTNQDEHQDIIPVNMFTKEIPANSTSVVEFRKATAEDTASGLLMQAVMNGWLESRKGWHPLWFSLQGTQTHHP